MSGAPGRIVLVVVALLGAGALGAVLRAVVTARSPRLGLHAVNVLGTAVLAATGVAVADGSLAPGLGLVLGVGLAGSLTTFSGWMALITDRAERVGWWRALAVDAIAPVLVAVGVTVALFAAG